MPMMDAERMAKANEAVVKSLRGRRGANVLTHQTTQVLREAMEGMTKAANAAEVRINQLQEQNTNLRKWAVYYLSLLNVPNPEVALDKDLLIKGGPYGNRDA